MYYHSGNDHISLKHVSEVNQAANSAAQNLDTKENPSVCVHTLNCVNKNT